MLGEIANSARRGAYPCAVGVANFAQGFSHPETQTDCISCAPAIDNNGCGLVRCDPGMPPSTAFSPYVSTSFIAGISGYMSHGGAPPWRVHWAQPYGPGFDCSVPGVALVSASRRISRG